MALHDAIVMGAGIQGCLSALMLAKRGLRVAIVDQRDDVLTGASLNYEGRIHTGMLYAMDRSFATADRMAQDAVTFAPAIEAILGEPIDWARYRLPGSRYLVHRDSNLKAESLQQFWTQIETRFNEAFEDPSLHYLGQRPPQMFQETAIPKEAASDIITAAFDTAEAFVDQVAFNALIRRAVEADSRIELFLQSRVAGVAQHQAGQIRVTLTDRNKQKMALDAETVVNCLWEERHGFDQMMGLGVRKADESLRLKFSLLVKTDPFLRKLGSVIITHGAYGSVVVDDTSPTAFVSWYPACVEKLIAVQAIPPEWKSPLRGVIPEDVQTRLLRDNWLGFQQIFPEFPALKPHLIKAGVIVAHGRQDIDHPNSGLHERNEEPIASNGGFYSVSTSKYTSSGRNTLALERRIFGDTKLRVSNLTHR